MYQVFLADDEEWALITLRKMIAWDEWGFAVAGEAADGKSALERILRTEPDLIISDIRMPGLDGIALLNELRKNQLESEVLLVSAYTDFEYAREALRLGCAGYLVKPVEEADLANYLEIVKKKLDTRKSQRAENGEEEGYLSERALVHKMVDFIRLHYAEPVTLQTLADAFGMSESYISSLIKKKTEKGFSDHLLDFRIQKAQELLKNSNDSIEQIAQRVGYSDYYYFTKVYKKATGISPSTYRKQL